MNILHIKTIIEEKLSKNDESVSFNDALSDCAYACSLGNSALEGHIKAWLTERAALCASLSDAEYVRGIEWVQNLLDGCVSVA